MFVDRGEDSRGAGEILDGWEGGQRPRDREGRIGE